MATPRSTTPVEVRYPEGPAVPLVLDSPHSGRRYPADFGAVLPLPVLRRLEDAYVDALYADAPAYGATLIAATFPRSYVDPNRHEADLDPDMLDGPWPREIKPMSRGADWQRLFWSRAYDAGPIYDGRLPVAAALARLDGFHAPYHRALAEGLDARVEEFGRVVHLNCHSMPSVGQLQEPDEGRPRPDFILGDREGATCGAWLRDRVRGFLQEQGFEVAVNAWYKGGEIVRRYGRPGTCDSLQIEINRGLYLDEEAVIPAPGFEPLRRSLAGLVAALAVDLQALATPGPAGRE